MTKASYKDKNLFVDILTKSFDANQSVNYIVKQDKKRIKRISALMSYSFEVCYLFGDVFLSGNEKACALVLYPDKKSTTLKSILLDMKLIFSCIGIENIKKALVRESKIRNLQPKASMYYLWFIGVDPEYQGQGIGNNFLDDIVKDSEKKQKPVYLETSTLKNLPWYEKFGFQIYHELDLNYRLFFLRKETIQK
ncbi:MAG: GNAT family N-acetyltransferase [Ginsengibacter sp.]